MFGVGAGHFLEGLLRTWVSPRRGAPEDPDLRPTPTSPTALERMWTIFSCGVATTLCPLISMILCPTRTPPLSAIPPRMRLQICQSQRPSYRVVQGTGWGQRTGFSGAPHPSSLRSCHDEALGIGIVVSLHKKQGSVCPHGHFVHALCTENISRSLDFTDTELGLLFIPVGSCKKNCLGLSPGRHGFSNWQFVDLR